MAGSHYIIGWGSPTHIILMRFAPCRQPLPQVASSDAYGISQFGKFGVGLGGGRGALGLVGQSWAGRGEVLGKALAWYFE